ncbi:MAG: DUF1844 domain-containing protein [Planctomycetes bacterium]|nr:DUF1844 domain-containing protein [Planctomycetota bacterium]
MADEKRIIIDEDWKAQVQAEKDAAAKSKPADAPQGAAPQPSDAGDVPMPPASLELLLTMLATEALVALGQVPHPATGQVHVQRNQAKYLIDTVDMLREKTKGNLTPGEQQLIETLLHQLRMAFVETTNQPATGASR